MIGNNACEACGKIGLSRASEGVNVAPKTPYTPTIDTPQEGASVGSAVTLTGRALPGASVRVTLKYMGRKVVVPASGQIASDTPVSSSQRE